MIKWLKSWYRPDILRYNIDTCGHCQASIRLMSRGTQRKCKLIPKKTLINPDDFFTFYCGQCSVFTEYVGDLNTNEFQFIRVLRTVFRDHEMLVQDARDVQVRYNVAVVAHGKTWRPDRTELHHCTRKQLTSLIRRLNKRIKNLERAQRI